MAQLELRNVPTYRADGRLPLAALYAAQQRLAQHPHWSSQEIFTFTLQRYADTTRLPVRCFTTKRTGPALWLLAGVHGEEPAGPNAVAAEIDRIAALGKRIPMVVLPLLNPLGYRKNWRYFDYRDRPRDAKKIHSVSDAEHYLPQLNNPKRARLAKPSSAAAAAITTAALGLMRRYPPLLTIDFHEDKSKVAPYIYSQGALGHDDPVAQAIVRLMLRAGLSLQMHERHVWPNAWVKNGIAADEHDGSIDELLAAEHVIVGRKRVRKPAAKSVITVETQALGVPLKRRVDIHRQIIRSLPRFWEMAKD